MISADDMKDMQEEIRAMETELAEKKKELREAKYAGLRTAMHCLLYTSDAADE